MSADVLIEAARQLTVCNSCRYCEGYCSVFPALERRAIVLEGDAVYLANLCHDCRACHQACMYAPPHDLAVNLPAALSAVRAETMGRYAWPAAARALFRRGGEAAAAFLLAGLLLAVAAVAATGGLPHLLSASDAPGAFYRIVPYAVMLVPALAVSLFVAAVLHRGGVRLWRQARTGAPVAPRALWEAWPDALAAALTLRNLRGGGDDCYYPDAGRSSPVRRWLHILLVAGFGLAFVSTVLAAIWQHALGQLPPYPLLSPPVVTGSAGGVAMIVGCSGLLYLKTRAPAGFAAASMLTMDVAFLAVLDLASVTGMLTLALRGTPAVGPMLVLHLAFLTALYATAPYGKFTHAVHRFTALLLDSVERRQERPPARAR